MFTQSEGAASHPLGPTTQSNAVDPTKPNNHPILKVNSCQTRFHEVWCVAVGRESAGEADSGRGCCCDELHAEQAGSLSQSAHSHWYSLLKSPLHVLCTSLIRACSLDCGQPHHLSTSPQSTLALQLSSHPWPDCLCHHLESH